MYYAVFVSRVKQAMEMPNRAEVEPDFGVVADGVGPRIEDAVRMALRKDVGLTQLAVLEGEEVGSLPDGKVIFKPTGFTWCLPREEALEEVSEVYSADEPEPEPVEESDYQEPVTTAPVRERSDLRKYGWSIILVAVAAIGGSIYFSRPAQNASPAYQPAPAFSQPAGTTQTQQSTPTQSSPPPATSVQVSSGNPTPAAPSGLQVVSTGPAVQISWTGAAGSNQYTVYRSTTPSQSSAQPVTTTLQTTYTDNNVQPLQTYYYWVGAQSNGGTVMDPNFVQVTATYSFAQLHSMDAQDIVKIEDMTLQQWNTPGNNYSKAGTGFYLSNGDIVTCYHVISGNWARIQVMGYSGAPSMLDAKVIWTDPAHDLAVLQQVGQIFQKPPGLQLSGTFSTGEPVAVLGHPGGEALTMTTGQITGTLAEETVTGYGILPNMIMMNVPAVGGNSGSPVLNGYGQVVGIMESAGAHNGNQSFAVETQYLSGS